MKRIFALLLILQLCLLRAFALEKSAMREAAAYSAKERGSALLIVQHGRKIFEEYPNGHSAGETNRIYSGTKAFWIMAALVADEQGLLKLDEKASETLPEWRDDPQRSHLTIRQLLNFTAGLAPDFALHENGISNRNARALKEPIVAEPGSTFIYGPSSLQVFHEILKRKLERHSETPTTYLERKVLRPLGLGKQRYLADSAGNPLLAAGFLMTAWQWERMGKLILHHGAPVVNSRIFSECLTGTSANAAFGMGLWTNHAASHSTARVVDPEEMLDRPWRNQEWGAVCLSKAAPSDLIASIGSAGQRIYVVPSLELIVVRQGSNAKFRDDEFLGRLFQ